MPQPYIKFYFRDWEADVELMACSLAARGLWIHMLRVMHESPTYGYLLPRTGEKLDIRVFARRIGCTPAEVTRAIAELEQNRVLERDEAGTIYSRRMLREADKRAMSAAFGKSGGGNPALKAAPTLPYIGGYKGEVNSPPLTHGNNHSHSQVPKSIDFGTAWLKKWTDPASAPDPGSWLDALGARFSAIVARKLRTLSVAERETMARVHAAILGNANVDEVKNSIRATGMMAPFTRLATSHRLGDLTCREYVRYGLKMLEIRKGKPFWNPFDIEAAIEYE